MISRQKAIVAKHGEFIDINNQRLKASIVESTKATYSMAGRSYFVQGQVFKGKPAIKVGDYFKRKVDKNTYFINTLLPEPQAEDLFFMYAVMCNATISIYRTVESVRNEYGDKESNTILMDKDVCCYLDVSTRSNKATNDGMIDQSIYTLMLPHNFMLSEGDNITAPMNISGETGTGIFRVESIGSQVIGIDMAQLLLIGKKENNDGEENT